MVSGVLYITQDLEFQEKLNDLKSQNIPIPSVWHLAPGVYNLDFKLPSFLKIKGEGTSLTTIKIKDTCMLESNNILEDITFEYSYVGDVRKSTDVLQLFIINCVDYLEQYKRPDDLIYNNTVIFRNCDFKFYNLEDAYVFNILMGNLKLENVSITHSIYDWEVNNNLEVHNLFTLNYLCHLELINCEINYETKISNTFLITGNISSITMRDTVLNLDSNLELEECYVFYLISTKLNLEYSKLKNLVRDGKIFFWDEENDFEFKNLISNFQIANGNMLIKKIGESKNSWRLVSFLSGFLYQEKQFIFDKIFDLEDEYRIELLNYHSFKDTDIVIDPDISLLFLVSITHSFLLDNTEIDLREEIPNNYILEIQNLTYQNKQTLYQVNELRKINNKFNYQDGTLEINNLKVEKLSSVQLHHIFKCDQGYSLLDKSKVGLESVDLTLGNSSVDGSYNFASGLDIQCVGHYSTVLGRSNIVSSNNGITIGNNLINKFDNCLVLGKYNTDKLDREPKLLVVGNGNSKEKSDALTIFESGDVRVQSSLEANKISDGFCSLQEGNLLGVQNLEIEGNLFINNTVEVEGKIEGYTHLGMGIPCKSLEIAGEIISTWKLDLSLFDSPTTYGKIIPKKEAGSNVITDLDETIHGLIYEMEVICIETPSRQDVRFLISEKDNLGCLEQEEFIDLISSYEWTKGKRILEKEKIKFDWNYEIPKYYLYIAREVKNSMYQDIGDKKLTGKFLIRTRGTPLF